MERPGNNCLKARKLLRPPDVRREATLDPSSTVRDRSLLCQHLDSGLLQKCETINFYCLSNLVYGASLVAQTVKNLPAMQETWIRSPSWEDPLEKGMATHSSILAGESHGQRSLGGYSLWGRKEWGMTDRLCNSSPQELIYYSLPSLQTRKLRPRSVQ